MLSHFQESTFQDCNARRQLKKLKSHRSIATQGFPHQSGSWTYSNTEAVTSPANTAHRTTFLFQNRRLLAKFLLTCISEGAALQRGKTQLTAQSLYKVGASLQSRSQRQAEDRTCGLTNISICHAPSVLAT